MRTVRGYGSAAIGATLAFCLAGSGCGRSALLTENDAATGDAGASASRAGMTFGGSKSTAGGPAFGGTFGQSGTFGSAGFPSVGGFPNGGFPNGGQTSDTCQLAVGDCRLASDAGCEAVREACEGVLLSHQEFVSSEVHVTDVATSTNGRVAIAGTFEGVLDLGGQSKPFTSIDQAGTTHQFGFVASFDAGGQAEWLYVYATSGTSTASGVRFTPTGHVVAQGADGGEAFAVRLDAQGVIAWSARSLDAIATPGHVGVDNDGNVLLSGTYKGTLNLAGAQLTAARYTGYLIKVDEAGKLAWARDLMPSDWQAALTRNVAVDDEDSIAVIGIGADPDGGSSAFLQKFGPTGELRFSKELRATTSVELRGLTVDRKMRLLVAGEFTGQLTNANESFDSSGSKTDVWLAQYSGDGELGWQRVYASDGQGAHAAATAVDPYGNVVLTGSAAALAVDGLDTLTSPSLFLLKLRPDATPIWLRSFDGTAEVATLASDTQSNFWLGGSFDGKLGLDTDLLDGAGMFHGMLLKLGP